MIYSAETFALISAIGFGVLIIYEFGEMAWLSWISKKRPWAKDFQQPVINLGVVAVISTLVAVLLPLAGAVAYATLGTTLAPFHFGTDWYIWIVALIIYEFWYWLQHWLAHKVRLLWCLHSPHHAPKTINMIVGSNHHFLESVFYFPFFFGFMPALCGVPVEMIAVIAVIDVIWGSFLHISGDVVKFRYGPLEYFLQTPSYHRAHHGKNARYMDTNYNSITLFWDYVMGTRVVLDDNEPVDYGITRDVNTMSFWDVQFGDFKGLWRDVRQAPGLKNKLAYLFMPPGWSHTGDHQTAAVKKQEANLEGTHNA